MNGIFKDIMKQNMNHQQLKYSSNSDHSYGNRKASSHNSEHIKFFPSQPAHDEKGEIVEQPHRDSNGDEIDMNCNIMRLYKAIQSQEFRDRKLFIATDGGVAKFKGDTNGKGAVNVKGTMNSKGSIGFLITDNEGNPFIR